MITGILLHVFLMAEVPLEALNNREKTIENNYNKDESINDPEELHILTKENNILQSGFEDNNKKRNLKKVKKVNTEIQNFFAFNGIQLFDFYQSSEMLFYLVVDPQTDFRGKILYFNSL